MCGDLPFSNCIVNRRLTRTNRLQSNNEPSTVGTAKSKSYLELNVHLISLLIER